MHKLATITTVLGLLLWGCGSSTDSNTNGSFNSPPGSSAAANSAITGKVVDNNGVPQSGVRVVVQERGNNFRAIGASGADGTFRFDVVAGV